MSSKTMTFFAIIWSCFVEVKMRCKFFRLWWT